MYKVDDCLTWILNNIGKNPLVYKITSINSDVTKFLHVNDGNHYTNYPTEKTLRLDYFRISTPEEIALAVSNRLKNEKTY